MHTVVIHHLAGCSRSVTYCDSQGFLCCQVARSKALGQTRGGSAAHLCHPISVSVLATRGGPRGKSVRSATAKTSDVCGRGSHPLAPCVTRSAPCAFVVRVLVLQAGSRRAKRDVPLSVFLTLRPAAAYECLRWPASGKRAAWSGSIELRPRTSRTSAREITDTLIIRLKSIVSWPLWRVCSHLARLSSSVVARHMRHVTSAGPP